MRRSFDTRVSISVENGLSIGLVQALATLVLVSTYIYLEKAAKLAAIYRHLGLPRSTWPTTVTSKRSLYNLCVDTLPSIPKGYVNRCNIAAVVSSWLSMPPVARDLGGLITPALLNLGACPLGRAAEIGTQMPHEPSSRGNPIAGVSPAILVVLVWVPLCWLQIF
jgi:hypothetical protein